MGVRPPIYATVGPVELAAGRTYVHHIDLDENLAIGMRVEICDDALHMFAATVTDRTGSRWQLTIHPSGPSAS
jgi:hypothetical protein